MKSINYESKHENVLLSVIYYRSRTKENILLVFIVIISISHNVDVVLQIECFIAQNIIHIWKKNFSFLRKRERIPKHLFLCAFLQDVTVSHTRKYVQQTCTTYSTHFRTTCLQARAHTTSFLFPSLFVFYVRALMPRVGGTAICSRAGVMANKLRTRI